jgi:hypothetical protein
MIPAPKGRVGEKGKIMPKPKQQRAAEDAAKEGCFCLKFADDFAIKSADNAPDLPGPALPGLQK